MSAAPLAFTPLEPGQRLDQYLASQLSGYSRSAVKALIERGSVTVDGAPAAADRKLRGGERVCVSIPLSGWAETEPLEDWVLFEDPQVLVLRKPAGLLMHPLGETWLSRPEAALSEPEPNLAGLLLKRRAHAARAGLERCGLVHRLDRQTSGALVVAKTPQAQKALIRAFQDRKVEKFYRAVVRGVPQERQASVEAPVGREPGHRKVLVTPFGKTAQTRFTVLEKAPAHALVEAKPLTGRTHQIRAHLALIGHPVAGDVEFDKSGAKPVPPRLMLHAFHLAFEHPKTGKRVEFEAPLPKDFQAFWKECLVGRPSAARKRR